MELAVETRGLCKTYHTNGVEVHALRGVDLRDFYVRHPETGRLVLERLAAVIAVRLQNTHVHIVELLEQGLRVDVNESVFSN